MLPVDGQRPLIHGHNSLAVEIEVHEDIPTDNIVSEHSAGNTDLFTSHDRVEAAGHEKINNAVVALRFPNVQRPCRGCQQVIPALVYLRCSIRMLP